MPGRILSTEDYETVIDSLGELAIDAVPASDYLKLEMGGEAILELLTYMDPSRVPPEKPRWPGDGLDVETLDLSNNALTGSLPIGNYDGTSPPHGSLYSLDV